MKKTHLIPSTLLIISSVSYVALEMISIISSKSSFKGYFHTISELSTPIGEKYRGIESNFSPLSYLFNSILIINGIVYFIGIGYYIIKMIKPKFIPLCLMMSTLTGIGTILVGFFHSSTNPVFIHYVSTALVFLFGNILPIVMSFCTSKNTIIFKIIGISGLIAGFFCLILPKNIIGIFERFTIYPIIAHEIVCGITLLKDPSEKRLESINV